jgi:hypothetical protein
LEQRGYSNTAQLVLMTVEGSPEGYKTSAKTCFKDGCSTNGGAMRITPVGLAFRSASDIVLLRVYYVM